MYPCALIGGGVEQDHNYHRVNNMQDKAFLLIISLRPLFR
jgi:hypothetical protein